MPTLVRVGLSEPMENEGLRKEKNEVPCLEGDGRVEGLEMVQTVMNQG